MTQHKCWVAWLGRQTCDQQVTSSTPGRMLPS